MSAKYKKLNVIIIVIFLITISFVTYILFINKNSMGMTGRQKVLKTMYPFFSWLSKLGKKNVTVLSNKKVVPPISFYSLKATLNNGTDLNIELLKGKKLLLVNTASDCGYTAQYEQLQKLYEQYNNKLIVIGFPANDFKEQETGNDEQIASFCKINFGVTFPLMKKSVVIKNKLQNVIFQWLTDETKNGWNTQAPTWNFSKYLINEKGMLTNYFGPAVEPLSIELKNAIDKN